MIKWSILILSKSINHPCLASIKHLSRLCHKINRTEPFPLPGESVSEVICLGMFLMLEYILCVASFPSLVAQTDTFHSVYRNIDSMSVDGINRSTLK